MRKILLLISVISIIACSENKKEITRDSILIEKAKSETLERLKSPSTAKFVDSLHTVMRLKGENGPSESYRVMISVDAQNSFGAEVRDRYMVVLKDNGGDSLSVDNYEVKMFN